jgi:hypothetical protein
MAKRASTKPKSKKISITKLGVKILSTGAIREKIAKLNARVAENEVLTKKWNELSSAQQTGLRISTALIFRDSYEIQAAILVSEAFRTEMLITDIQGRIKQLRKGQPD